MNFLFIFMDDMRYDELAYMPNVQRLLVARGTNFTWCHANVALCSPARAGILTGQLSKHHGIITNLHFLSNAQHNSSSFAAVGAAGYRVGMVGKFVEETTGAIARTGFDFWRALVRSTPAPPLGIYEAYDYAITNGLSPPTVTEYTRYQEHQLFDEAIDFMRGGAEPWCLWYCPTSPHAPGEDPPNHTTEWGYTNFPLKLETDVSDKPTWIQNLAAIDETNEQLIQSLERVRLRELLAADEVIAGMVAHIEATGQADDTTVVFTSDNGCHAGEHRIRSVITKATLYEPAMRVPMVAWGPDFPHATVTVPTYQQDATATMLDVCNATAILPNQAGISLAAIAANPGAHTARKLLGFRTDQGMPTPAGMPIGDCVITNRYKLIRWQGEADPDKYELYDLQVDPDEWVNRAYSSGTSTSGSLTWAQLRASLETDLNNLLA